MTNPNSYPITLHAATFGTVTSDDPTACPASNITTNNKTGLSIAVPAGSNGTAVSIPGAVQLASSAPNGCQGRTFTIATTVTGTQS